MLSASFLAVLAASAVSASPMMARNEQPSYAAAPSYTTAPSHAYTSSAGWESYGSSSSSAAAPSGTQALGAPAKPNLPVPSGLVAELLTEASTVGRFTKIKEQIDAGALSLTFDHNPEANPNVTPGEGGQVDLANQANYPPLVDLGLSNAVIFFQACGLNTPHIHPRASEYFTLATDTKMSTGFVLENGLSDEFTANLTIWQGTVFPQGSLHWQQNESCEPAVGTAALSDSDPGASSMAQTFLRFTNPEVVEAALGLPNEINADNFAEFKDAIPASLAKGVQECLIRCNIKH
jgi:hypothetical protein